MDENASDVAFNNESNSEFNLDQNTATSNIYIPYASDEVKPNKGQEFETLDDAFSFYNSYAKLAGFSVRSSTTKREPGSDEVRRKEYICWKSGAPTLIADVERKRRRGSIGENCNAKIAFLRSLASGKYVVTVFHEGHTHPLSTPSKTHLLHSHRNVSAATKSLAKQLSLVNVPKHQQFSFLEVQSGGIENVGCTQRDLYNHGRDERADTKGHDAQMFYEYLKLEQVKNPSFTFTIDTDEDQKITRCFWSDATSRRAYNFYGDVVIFDTTYNTNRYGLIFAPIMGVNNHGQTIIFGCGFLNHESVDDFVWLFSKFLESMPSTAPKMIITDQDPAMTKAFPLVLPNTFHRYCSWHIIMKFTEKIDAVKYSIYKNEFSACIWKSETPEEFDLGWESLIKKSGLGNNTWLSDIYELRSRWIPAYVNHVFSANMSSSQRAESAHSFFKKFVSKNNSLLDFMVQFDRGLVRQRHEELMADHKDKIEKPRIRINHDFLVQMVEIYTNEIFYKFEDELCESFNYRFQLVRESDNQRVYHIQRKSSETSKVREIIYNKDLNFVSCVCKMFDSAGIPCRHILAYLMKFDDVAKLPDKYIMKRWSKLAKSGTVVVDSSGLHIVDDNSYQIMRSQYVQSCLGLVDKVLVCEETRKVFDEGLRSIEEKVDQIINNRTSEQVNREKSNTIDFAISAHASCNVESSYNEPDPVRAKGCGKRLKGGKEKALARVKNRKVRRCHGCGLVGQAHDKRNCPAITNLTNQSNPCNQDVTLEDGNELSTEDEDDISLV